MCRIYTYTRQTQWQLVQIVPIESLIKGLGMAEVPVLVSTMEARDTLMGYALVMGETLVEPMILQSPNGLHRHPTWGSILTRIEIIEV